jgi:cyclic pyranopterin monophosphate synthase
MKKLTHTDDKGKAVMIDVGEKKMQTRIAKARGHISLGPETIKLIRGNQLKKGDVITVAQIAGINAAKQTQNLIPLCHNITIDNIRVDLSVEKSGITAESVVKCTGKTGAEMEALSAVSLALLTIYDMCKAVDKKMIIDNIELVEKIKK